MRVQEAERPHDQEERDNRCDRRQHALRQEPDRQILILDLLIAEAGEGIGRRQADK